MWRRIPLRFHVNTVYLPHLVQVWALQYLGFLAVLGLQAFLLAVPSAYLALKICGGLYLLWMAFKIIKHAKEPIEAGDASSFANVTPSCIYHWFNYPVVESENCNCVSQYFYGTFTERDSNVFLLCTASFVFLYRCQGGAHWSLWLCQQKNPRKVY